MSKEIKNKILPELRFKEFKDNWEESKLESLIDLLSGYAFQSEYFSNIGMKLLIPKNFTKDGKANFNHENTKYTTENFDPKYICKEGDLMLLITDLSPSCELLGKPILLTKEDGEVLLNQRIIRVIPKSSIERRFLLYFFSTEIYHKRIKDTASGSTVRHSSNSIIAETQIYVPSTKEQQKIADCLSSLDEILTAENQKLQSLKKYKKGLMQQLFPAEGETVPKLRFKEFKDSGEWEEEELGDIAIFLKGKGISKSDIDPMGNQPCIRYGELYTHYKEIIKAPISFTNISHDELILSEPNDVIIPSSGETREDIATASCVIRGGVALGGDLNIIRSEINGVFLSYYLTHVKKEAIAKLAQGNAVVHLYSNQLKKLVINFSKLKNEQQKIADCLSTLDETISTQTEKIETLKIHKKGLMQSLFPNTTN